jgi:chromosome segregation ATPase
MARRQFTGSAAARVSGIMAAVGTGCQLLEGQIKALERQIAREERNIATLEARVKKMQGARNPDTTVIKQLQANIARQQTQLDSDNKGLSQLQDDLFFFCGR